MKIRPEFNQYLSPFQKWQLTKHGNVIIEQVDTHHMVDDEFENGVFASDDFKQWMDNQAEKQLN